MDLTKMKGSALTRSPLPRRDQRAPFSRWAWTALSLLLAAIWGTDVMIARRLSPKSPQPGNTVASDSAQGL